MNKMENKTIQFSEWWNEQPIQKSEAMPIIIMAFKEIAEKAWDAGIDVYKKSFKIIKAKNLVVGCIVKMSNKSDCIGHGNYQCVKGICEPLGEISLYGHNQNYKIRDIEKIIEYPFIESNE